MKYMDCVNHTPTLNELKRNAKAYVVDSKNLNYEELKGALIKTTNQYCNFENIEKACEEIYTSDYQKYRVITDILIRSILLNEDNYILEYKRLDEMVISFEGNIINLANETKIENWNENKLFFKDLLEVAWADNDNLSSDEINLLSKISNKFKITKKEYDILEAKITRYPQKNNILHSRGDVDEIRKRLQQVGLLFCVRLDDNKDYDVIPEEVAAHLKVYYQKEMKDYGYRKLLEYKHFRTKEHLVDILNRAGIAFNQYAKLQDLKELIFERVKPSNLLGGFSKLDGFSKDILINWCLDLGINHYGSKEDIIQKIISYYDSKKEINLNTVDDREVLFNFYEDLANRNIKNLRMQNIINKDLEIEHKFEEATDYIFEKIFKHKPLIMAGSEHPDGILSYNNKLIMWDNKSKETSVNIKDHIDQFQRYIRQSEKQVAIFIVIGPDFTANSEDECIKHMLNSDTQIVLLKASELKEIANNWLAKHSKDDEAFNLGYFKQTGMFNKNLVKV